MQVDNVQTGERDAEVVVPASSVAVSVLHRGCAGLTLSQPGRASGLHRCGKCEKEGGATSSIPVPP